MVMVSFSKQERHLKTLMRLSAIAYFVVGFAFAFLPEPILRVVNFLSLKEL